jgi:hypothetical protein
MVVTCLSRGKAAFLEKKSPSVKSWAASLQDATLRAGTRALFNWLKAIHKAKQ